MIGRRHHNDVARQLVNLHKEKGYDAFDFSGFVNVAPFLPNSIELIKQQNAWHRSDVFK